MKKKCVWIPVLILMFYAVLIALVRGEGYPALRFVRLTDWASYTNTMATQSVSRAEFVAFTNGYASAASTTNAASAAAFVGFTNAYASAGSTTNYFPRTGGFLLPLYGGGWLTDDGTNLFYANVAFTNQLTTNTVVE